MTVRRGGHSRQVLVRDRAHGPVQGGSRAGDAGRPNVSHVPRGGPTLDRSVRAVAPSTCRECPPRWTVITTTSGGGTYPHSARAQTDAIRTESRHVSCVRAPV